MQATLDKSRYWLQIFGKQLLRETNETTFLRTVFFWAVFSFRCAPFCNNNKEAVAGDEVTHGILCMDYVSATFCKQTSTSERHWHLHFGSTKVTCERAGDPFVPQRVPFCPPKSTSSPLTGNLWQRENPSLF